MPPSRLTLAGLTDMSKNDGLVDVAGDRLEMVLLLLRPLDGDPGETG